MSSEIVLRCRVFAVGNYRYLPFDVPPGVTRLDVSLTTSRRATVGLGLFDGRGAGPGSAGFRGITAEQRREVFLAPDDATPGFTPGPIAAGRWTVIVPVFFVPLPTEVTVRVRMGFGAAPPTRRIGPAVGVVSELPGWYRGDLHCHTEASSDAWVTGSALTPAGWAEVAREVGLDFLAMTDHNVISQNWSLAADAGRGVLLMAGEEMTNYVHGHATVSGIEPGQWLDFRSTPFGWPLPTGGQRIADFLAAAREMGAFVSAAHPLSLGLAWHFLAEEFANPAARPDGFEVWNGPWGISDEAALRVWDAQLRAGWAVVANGGSDLHGLQDSDANRPGLPTTVVYADALARGPIVAALRAGRCFVTSAPDGVEIYLSATTADGQATYVGGRLHGADEDAVSVTVLVRRGGGARLRLITAQGRITTVELTDDEQTVTVATTIGARYVRAEVRAGRLSGMRAFTNPIRFVTGPRPSGVTPEIAAPPR